MSRRALVLGAGIVVAPLPLVLLLLAALAARAVTVRRRRGDGTKPRLVYGPTPIIAIKYMREAMERCGYEARTVVSSVLHINAPDDYDYRLTDWAGGREGAFFPLRALHVLFAPYAALLWLLFRADVFHFFFDGGFLAGTPLRFLEVQLLHLAGKRVIVMPYGGDVMVPTEIRSLMWRQALAVDYPEIMRRERETRRQIDYFSRRADFVVGCLFHAETLPRWNLLTTHYYPIDTDAWHPQGGSSSGTGALKVFHAANHRALKGTEFVIDACEQLRREGLDVELVLAERLPNAEVRRLLQDCDVVAEQFLQGYALAAMEAMATGKPVLSNLSDPYYCEVHRRHTGLDECPILSTTPKQLEDNLRRLATDAELRRELGAAGRQYVERHHSYEAAGRMWEAIYRSVWQGEPLLRRAWHPDAGSEAAPADLPVEVVARIPDLDWRPQ
jgi:glycosyltransferase involved in cell wall biosynthesis